MCGPTRIRMYKRISHSLNDLVQKKKRGFDLRKHFLDGQTVMELQQKWYREIAQSNLLAALNGGDHVWSSLLGERPSIMVEVLLMHNDLDMFDMNRCPLLWHCANAGIVTETIANDEKLECQYGQKYEGALPLERGEYYIHLIM